MNCKESQNNFEAMLSGQLDSRVRSAVEAHFAQCPACATTFAEERRLWELMARAKKIEPLHGFADRVLRQLDVEPQRATRWWMAWGTLRWTSVAAAVLLVVGLSLTAIVRHQIEREKQARADHFADLFSVAQVDDPDTIVIAPGPENGDAL